MPMSSAPYSRFDDISKDSAVTCNKKKSEYYPALIIRIAST